MIEGNNYIIESLFRYPVKSMLGERISIANVGINGIQGDRIYMLTDEDGRFLTQREISKLALFSAAITSTTLTIVYRPTGESIDITLDSPTISEKTVSIWKREHNASIISNEANEWLSNLLGQKVQLVKTNSDRGYTRKITGRSNAVHINFPDGYPLLITGRKSLLELNKKLPSPVNWDRFRPNIVIDTKEAHEEDNWTKFQVGSLVFNIVKPCPRCKIIATDQDTGKLTKEPLATLSTYRKKKNSVIFGMYGYTGQNGVIQETQVITI